MGWEVRFLFRLSGKLQFVGGLLSHRRRLVFVVGGERQQAVSRHLLSRNRPARSSPSPFASPLPPPMVFRGGRSVSDAAASERYVGLRACAIDVDAIMFDL